MHNVTKNFSVFTHKHTYNSSYFRQISEEMIVCKLSTEVLINHLRTDPSTSFCTLEMDGLLMQSQKMTVRRFPDINCLMDLTASK